MVFATPIRAMKKLRGKSILVVDDDVRWLRALGKVLADEGATVIDAQWAGEVLDLLTAREIRCDLLITDLRMPFVNGLTVVYSVRKMFPALPVIVLTAFGSADVKAECLRQGAAAFLEKPLDSAALLDAINGVFASHPVISQPARPEGQKTSE